MVRLKGLVAFRNSSLARKAVGVVLGLVLVTTLDMLVSDGTVAGLFTNGITVSSANVVKSVGVDVYWNRWCTKRVWLIDWGMVEPSSTKDVTVFVRNEGDLPVRLSLDAINWRPSNAPDFVSLAWDYDGRLIKPRKVIKVVLTLSMSPSIERISTFDFTVQIAAR